MAGRHSLPEEGAASQTPSRVGARSPVPQPAAPQPEAGGAASMFDGWEVETQAPTSSLAAAAGFGMSPRAEAPRQNARQGRAGQGRGGFSDGAGDVNARAGSAYTAGGAGADAGRAAAQSASNQSGYGQGASSQGGVYGRTSVYERFAADDQAGSWGQVSAYSQPGAYTQPGTQQGQAATAVHQPQQAAVGVDSRAASTYASAAGPYATQAGAYTSDAAYSAADAAYPATGPYEASDRASATGKGSRKAKAKTGAKKKPSLISRLAGLLGELLITAGAFIGLFIVWQVWWTDIVANRAQEEQITSITRNWGGHEEKPTGADAQPVIGQPRTDEPPPAAHANKTGTVEGIMRIPAFGRDYKHTIEHGTSLKGVLDTGAFGHYEGTASVGEIGNYALAAHRQTYGAPMKNVDKLKVDDTIIVETAQAYYVYKVKSSYTVTPDSVEVVAPVPNAPGQAPTQRLLTITTCHPPFISDKRWVVHAEFDHWVARSDGIPQELAQK